MKNTDYKAKYIHIIYRNEVKFSKSLVSFLNEPSVGLSPEQHMFITPHKKVYEELKSYGNVFLDTSNKCLINKYAPLCDWIICHSFYDFKDVFKIKHKYLKKILFRYWGGGFGFQYKKGQLLQNLVKIPANIILKKRFNTFAAIGIAKNVDKLNLENSLKTDRFYHMPYARLKADEILTDVKNNPPEKDGIINVALYHRGTKEGNHIEILKKLERFGEKIRVYVPLSYGDEKYIEKVKKYIKENPRDNVIIVDEFMEYGEYVQLINKMDIGIFDCTTSTALGNITVYVCLQKKILLNRDGVIKRAFDEENIPHSFVDELDSISLEELSEMPSYPEEPDYNLLPVGKAKGMIAWKKILEDFN